MVGGTMNLSDIDGETIARAEFKDKQFERFVRELLDHERRERHDPSAMLEGPGERYVGDGQRDLVFTVVAPPRSPRGFDALTWDDLGETWYSCKGGSGWAKAIKDELGHAAYRAFRKTNQIPSEKVRQPSRVLLEHLAAGGRYVFVISQPSQGSREFLAVICELMRFWLDRAGARVPDRLGEQFAFLDANRLADFIRHERPLLHTDTRCLFNVAEPTCIESRAEWRREMVPGRRPPEFESDEARDHIIAILGRDFDKQIVRVIGPPGVGKTRVVYEALSRGPDAEARVRYCREPDALFDHMRVWLPQAGKLTLVVDEVRSIDVREMISKFRSHADRQSRLVLVGTSDAEATREHPDIALLPLATLAPAATRAIVEAEFLRAGVEPDDRIATILTLAEGYPLFAVKLAEALAIDGDAIAAGRDETNSWLAAMRVLVGPRARCPDPEWRREADIRGRCLLVAILTREQRISWEELWETQGPALTKAVDGEGEEKALRHAAKHCIEREILREFSGRRYVSPANLARIIINHYLSGLPGPDLGPKILRYAPDFVPELVSVAKEVHVESDILRRFASMVWTRFSELVRDGDLGGLQAILSTQSRWASEEDPSRAARAAAELSQPFLRELDPSARRDCALMLLHVTRRKVDFEVFRVAEGVLASILIIGKANDYIQDGWESLWLATLNPTHQAWSSRFELFEAHARSSVVDERLLAARALGRLLGDERHGPMYDPNADSRDGEWPKSSIGEYVEAKASCWDIALELADDAIPDVAGEARAAIGEQFRDGVGLWIRHIERLIDLVPGWTSEQRQRLFKAVHAIQRIHTDKLEQWPHMAAALARLEVVLQPKSLWDQLVARVATLYPAPWDPSDLQRRVELAAELDRELARRLLSERDHVDEALRWLSTKVAVRAWYFMIELGRVDSERRILPNLKAHALATGEERLLAAYLVGWSRADEAGADAWVAGEGLREYGSIAAIALSAFAPCEYRFVLLEKLVEAGFGRAEIMRSFTERRWITRVEPGHALEFLASLFDAGQAPTAGFEMVLQLWSSPTMEDRLRPAALDLLERFLAQSTAQRVPLIAQPAWIEAAKLLAGMGRLGPVADQLVSLLRIRSASLDLAEQALRELLAGGFAKGLWKWLRDALLDPEGEGFSHHLARVDLLRHLDPEEVLAWVGDDRSRAQAVARLVRPYQDELGSIPEVLLNRFGSVGNVAEVLRKRALTQIVPDLGGTLAFEREQLGHARAWTQSETPEVRAWARRLVEELRESIEVRDAAIQFERRYA
ncbi:MAG: hypothetical protein HC927_02700 [Deltaproteobacteria bacterium]|nr:hypothetical protein [Deltaproteobacteria bacterium]